MVSDDVIADVRSATRAVSASIETRFVDLGVGLEAAVETIGRLTRTFDVVADELKGETLLQATQGLSQAGARVAALAAQEGAEQAAINQLLDLTSRIHGHAVQMAKAVSGIGMLEMNVRMEAVGIGAAGVGFDSFADHIGRTQRLAKSSLDQFTSELGTVRNTLHSAATGQAALARHLAAAQSIPSSLAGSVGAIRDRASRAVGLASSVAGKSRQIAARINLAVMALQIGDITRQRLEHIEFALGIVAEIQRSPDHVKNDWADLTRPQRRVLTNICCRMQSAQLVDTADEFDREVRQILSSVQPLSGDAQAILQLGNIAVGATDQQQGTFLGEVETQVAEVNFLLDALAAARKEADAVAASVLVATTRLVDHATTLQLLERDVRIMGLNMTLKCGRLGTVGKPLVVVAQELRAYASQIGVEANAVTASLGGVVRTVGCLSGPENASGDDPTIVGHGLERCLSGLRAAGGCLADARIALARDADCVVGLLRETIARAAVYEEFSVAVRRAAAGLAGPTDVPDDGHHRLDQDASAAADRLLEILMRSYTMDQERIVHDRHSSGRKRAMDRPAVAADGAGASADLEALLF